MILFCEECGRRNELDYSPEFALKTGFECVHCKTIIPPSILFPLLRKRQSTFERKPHFSWEPNPISFGNVNPSEKRIRTIVFQTGNGAAFDICAKVVPELENDLKIRKIDHRTLEIHFLPICRRSKQNGKFSGEGIILYDKYSNYICGAQVDFSRNFPLLSGIPNEINIGSIISGVKYSNYLIAENSGLETLRLQLRPNPNDFSMSARFVISVSHAMTIPPGKKVKIPYCFWPSEELEKDMGFTQNVRITTNEPGEKRKRNLLIQGKILAQTG